MGLSFTYNYKMCLPELRLAVRENAMITRVVQYMIHYCTYDIKNVHEIIDALCLFFLNRHPRLSRWRHGVNKTKTAAADLIWGFLPI